MATRTVSATDYVRGSSTALAGVLFEHVRYFRPVVLLGFWIWSCEGSSVIGAMCADFNADRSGYLVAGQFRSPRRLLCALLRNVITIYCRFWSSDCSRNRRCPRRTCRNRPCQERTGNCPHWNICNSTDLVGVGLLLLRTTLNPLCRGHKPKCWLQFADRLTKCQSRITMKSKIFHGAFIQSCETVRGWHQSGDTGSLVILFIEDPQELRLEVFPTDPQHITPADYDCIQAKDWFGVFGTQERRGHASWTADDLRRAEGETLPSRACRLRLSNSCPLRNFKNPT